MGNIDKFNLLWLEDPEVFQVNTLRPHSDYKIIDEDEKEIKPLYLNGNWNFKYYNKVDDVDFKFIEDSSILEDSIQVPGHIQLQGYGKPQYVNTMYPWDGHEKVNPPKIPKNFNPVGVYGTHFHLPEEFINKDVRISFQGVESCFYLWLNGKFIGYSENTFCPAEFDLTEAIKEKDNYLCAMVVQFCSGSWLEDQDFWRFSGIFRDVYLYKVGEVHIEDVELQPILKDNLQEGQLIGKIKVKNIHQENIRVKLLLEDLKVEALIFEEGTVDLIIGIENPKLWSAEEPNLYKARVILEDAEDDRFITGMEADIGFRRLELKGNIMLINGKRIIFKGVNRHEFNCKKGRAIGPEDIEKDIKILKKNNFNAVRTSHYPNRSEFYSLCDKYGLYVIDETNLETHGTWMVMGKEAHGEGIVPGDNMVWKEAVLNRGEAMVERDKNHPSILMWSCGNESKGGRVIKDLSEWFHIRDPYRLVHYEGVFWDRSYEDTSDIESQMYTKAKDIEDYLKDNPKKPFILCEYSHAMGNSFGGVQKYIELQDKYPMFQGGFIWDFMDQAILTKNQEGEEYLAVGGDFHDRPNDGYFCGDGLLFADGTVTPKMKEAKVLYSPVKIYCEGNRITIINNNLFKDTKDYEFIWCIKAEGKVSEKGTFNALVGPQQEKTVELDIKGISMDKEIILECSMVLKEDTPWAEKGYEVAFGQGIIEHHEYEDFHGKKGIIIDGDCNIGVKMANSFAMIAKNSGKLISFKNYGGEMLKGSLSPDFWRAPTDNDIGNKSNFNWAKWKIGSLYQQCESIEIYQDQSEVVTYLSMPTNPITRCKIQYSFYEDDIIKISMVILEGGGDAPACGLVFEMPPTYKNIQWYGNSQEEAYGDRENGCRIDFCSSSVKEQYTQYLNPQECGNKTKLRYFRVVDDLGFGIEVKSNKAFEASALPYTSHEIEEAYNILHLPPANNKVVVGVYEKKSGIGGDDSWGAPVHEEYRVNIEKGKEFIFYLKAINP